MANTPDKLRRKEERAFSVESSIQDVTMESFVSEEEAPPPVVLEPISPLPELNIEVLPKPNPHDEPEEFYQELEIKVKKYYRKRFYNEDCCTEEEFNELSQYEPVYDSDTITFDYTERKESIDFENLNIASPNRQQTKHEVRVTRDEKDEKSENSSEYSADFQRITFEAEVHREATDTDEAERVVNEINEDQVKEDVMDDQLDLEGGTRDDGENERSIRESHDPAISILDIMRSNTDRRQSMHSIRLSGHSSASSPLHVDFRRSKSLDFELDLMQVSALNNSTKMETTHQNNKTTKDPVSFHNMSIDENDNDERATKSEQSFKSLAKGFNRKTSTPKSKPTSIDNNNSSLISGEDKSEYSGDHEDASNINKKIDTVTDNKSATTDLPGKDGSSDDEYNTYEIATISNSDMNIEKKSADKATTGNDSINNFKDSGDKSVPMDKIANKMERRYLVAATSTPISETAITQSEKTSSISELNTARISWPSSTKGTKRVLEEIPEEDLPPEHKRLKLIDVGVQATDNNSDWNDLRNSFFIVVPRMYKLCCCKNHICNR